MRIIFMCLLVVGFSVPTLTQPPPPASTSGVAKKFAGWPSISSVPSTEQFVSLEGRFRVALPKEIQGFGALSPKQTGSTATGQQLTWKFAECDVVLFFLDFPDSALTGSVADLDQITANSKKLFTDRYPNAKLISENAVVANNVPSSYFVYDFGSDGFISVQLYLDKKRLYRFNVAFKDAKTEKQLAPIFASFKLITQAEIDAELSKKYAAMMPAPLPQTPVVTRLTSDAEDEGFRGKIKKVVEESEDSSGTRGVQGRKISSVEYYDEKGALTQRDDYDSQGNPFQITVYGYIDGKRVSDSKTTSYGYDPPPAALSPKTEGTAAQRKSDPRYEYSFEYKYENGKLVERQMMYNNGRKGMRSVYKYAPNQIEELVYTDEGKLNQRYLSNLDANNNVIEETNFGVVNFDIYGDRKYKHSYEFDGAGNWVKKITLIEEKVNGVIRWQPAYVSYRTITYY